jgi:acyl-coenzyme A synthetase/AMP-(fatty) acid ligase
MDRAMNYNAVNDFIKPSPYMAIYHEDKRITYNDLHSHVCRYANALTERFIPGDEILISMDDCPEYFYLFWGAVKTGVIPSLLNTLLTEKEAEPFINDKKYKHIFTNENIVEFDAAARDNTDNPAISATRDTHAFNLFSSGTTGYIKSVPHNHGDMTTVAINYAKKTLNITAYDVCFSAAKLSFAYGLGNSMLFPLFNRAATVLMSEATTPRNTLDMIEKYRPSIYFGVPTLYVSQLKSLRNNPRDLSSLRLCVSAGEALPGKIMNEWKSETGKIILDGIGTTEVLHIFISNRIEDHEPDCSGHVVPGYKVKVTDIAGNEVEDGQIGYLKVKGDSIPGGEWIDTGDMFVKQGLKYYYRGRSNDMLKISGKWVSPTVIESKIMEHPAVLEVGVVESSDLNGLLKPKAYVVLNDADQNTINTKHEIKRKCIDELPANHYPSWIEFVDSLPKTPTGKIKRHLMRIWEAYSPYEEETNYDS